MLNWLKNTIFKWAVEITGAEIPPLQTARRMLPLLLICALLLSGCHVASHTEKTPEAVSEAAEVTATELEVHFFDAGKADAILLSSTGGTVLVDAGEKGFGKTILEYLEEKRIDRIDYLIISHFDQDHVGGAAKVINNIAVGTVLQSNYPKDSEEYGKYIKALANAELEPVTVRESYSFTLDGVSYTVDPPRQTGYAADSSNNSSLIVSVENGDNRILLSGDAQTERLAEFIDSNSITYDVLKLPHHGQDEPLIEAFLQSTKPTYAVITSSEEKPESETVMEALRQIGAVVLLTREGAVTFQSNGTDITVRS